MATLTWADNGDGSGGIATITGSPGGSTNNVLASEQGSGSAFAFYGSRVGDGTLALPVPVGTWWFQLQSVASGVTTIAPIVSGFVSSGALSILDRCLDAVLGVIRGLPLERIPPAQVLKQIQINTKPPQFPLVSVNYGKLKVSAKPLDSEARIMLGYGIKVEIIDRTSTDYTANIPLYTLWLRQCLAAFWMSPQNPAAAPPFGSVPEVWKLTVEDITQGESMDGKYQEYRSSFTVRCWSRET